MLKWTCTAATGAVLAVLIASCFTSLLWGRGRMSYLRVYQDLVEVEWDGAGAPLVPWCWPQLTALPAPRLVLWPPEGRFVFHQKLHTSIGTFPMDFFRVPMWPLLVLTALPTAVLWWRGRRRPGRCPECGYDLAGNTSGVCPECGRQEQQSTR